MHEKKSVTIFVYEANWKKTKIFTAEIACLKASNFSQTEPVDGMNWFNSKLYYSIGLLEKLKFSQTDSNDELNWSTPKLGSFSFSTPPHTSFFFSLTSGFTRLSIKTKYICRGLISLYVNFHNNPIKWSTNLHVKLCRWRREGKRAQSLSSLHEKNIGNQFRLWTDPVYELNWSTSKLQSSNSWLEKLNCFESWSSLWNEFVIFKCSEEIAWKFQRFRKLILSLKWIEILQSFINQIAGSKKNQTV